MHKPVRYHITESNDQPIVRSVEVSLRGVEDRAYAVEQPEATLAPSVRMRLNRSSLSSRLKPRRSPIPNA